MPHIPDTRHADHDAELVAAYAAGDAEGAALDAATAMVAGCPECAALHHDLRAIAAALPALAPPVRTRDFRLTPDQAASLRSSRWRRLLDTVAGPRFRLATPVGTGLAALGVAGLLLGSLAGTPLVPAGTGAAASAAGPEVQRNASEAGPEMTKASAAPSAGDQAMTGLAASPAPAASFAPFVASGTPSAAASAAAGAAPAPGTVPDATGGSIAEPVPAATPVPAPDAAVQPLVAASVAAVAVGLLLVTLRILGARAGRAS